MNNPARDYVRSQPKPTHKQALNFARSVMMSKGVDTSWGPYKYGDGLSIKAAKAALEVHAIDTSECMALEMCIYAMEPNP